MKDKDGNEIPGSEPTPRQDDPPQPTPDPVGELTKQIADLTQTMKKQGADLEIMREENGRLQSMLRSVSDFSGDDPNSSRRSPPRGSGRFSDPANRSEFEKKYSLPVEAAEEIVDEAVSRATRHWQERDEALRNAETLKRTFFEKYPDLVDYQPVVKFYADQCANEHPNWTVEEGMKEVARMAREYVKSKLSNSPGRGEPPEVLPAGGGSRSEGAGAGRLPGSPSTDDPARVPTQDEEIRAEMESRRGTRSKAL